MYIGLDDRYIGRPHPVRILLDSDGFPAQRQQGIEQFGNRHSPAAADIVCLARTSPFHEQRIGTNHIPHIGEIPSCRQISHTHHGRTQSGFDLGDLQRKIRCHKLRRLSHADMIERTHHHDGHSIGTGIDAADHILAGLRHGVQVARPQYLLLTDGGGADIAVLLAGADQQDPGIVRLNAADGIEQMQHALDIHIHRELGILPRNGHRALRSQMVDPGRPVRQQQLPDPTLVSKIHIKDLHAVHLYALAGELRGTEHTAALLQLTQQVFADKAAGTDH